MWFHFQASAVCIHTRVCVCARAILSGSCAALFTGKCHRFSSDLQEQYVLINRAEWAAFVDSRSVLHIQSPQCGLCTLLFWMDVLFFFIFSVVRVAIRRLSSSTLSFCHTLAFAKPGTRAPEELFCRFDFSDTRASHIPRQRAFYHIWNRCTYAYICFCRASSD